MTTSDEANAIDLFDVIDAGFAEDPRCFDSQLYDQWEREVATPALVALGYNDIHFWTADGDSFGPLVRGVRATKDGQVVEMFYG